MAASGYTPIQLYRTTTAAAVPLTANLAPGELAINIANGDMALFAENASGTVTRLMNNPAGLKYPTADGTAGQIVKTDGAGVLSFVTASGGLTLGTPVASTSGTAITFTGIPAGTKQIVISFSGVSTNGTSRKLIRLGDSGGIEITSYFSGSHSFIGSVIDSNDNNTGFLIYSELAAQILYGSMVLTLENSSAFRWALFGIVGSAGNDRFISAGTKALSAELDRIQVTTVNGTDSFDAGEINIAYM